MCKFYNFESFFKWKHIGTYYRAENIDRVEDGCNNLPHHNKSKKPTSERVGFMVTVTGTISLMPGTTPNSSYRLIGVSIDGYKVKNIFTGK